MKHDLAMQKEVCEELEREVAVVPGSIGVEVHHGVVKLAGCVRDKEAQQIAALAAQRVVGVTRVIMDLDVAGARRAI